MLDCEQALRNPGATRPTSIDDGIVMAAVVTGYEWWRARQDPSHGYPRRGYGARVPHPQSQARFRESIVGVLIAVGVVGVIGRLRRRLGLGVFDALTALVTGV